MAAAPPDHPVNPYIAGSAVSGAEMFFGREDVFAFIRRNLIGRHSNHAIVLCGQRRTGKTSVLYQLRRHLGPEYWCIFVDLHGLNLDGLGNLVLGIATAISRELRRDRQVIVEVPERSAFLADPAAAFERVFFDRVWAALGDNQLVLMMDEVARLDEEVRAGRLDRQVFEYLRHLMQHHDRLNFVFSLGSGIEEMSRDYAFLFSVSLYHQISFLEPAAARELITRPARGHYELTDQAVERIIEITSAHPYYTQLVCHCVFAAWARNPAAVVGAGDIDDVLAEAVERGSANLTHVWLDSSPAEQAVMAGIATATQGTGAAVTPVEVRETWRNAGVDIPAQEITRALRGLIRREVITDGSAHSFTVDLQRRWIDRHRRFARVKEDLAGSIAEWEASAPPSADIYQHSPAGTERPLDAGASAPPLVDVSEPGRLGGSDSDAAEPEYFPISGDIATSGARIHRRSPIATLAVVLLFMGALVLVYVLARDPQHTTAPPVSSPTGHQRVTTPAASSPPPKPGNPVLYADPAVFFVDIPPSAVLGSGAAPSREVSLLTETLNTEISASTWKGKRPGFVEVFASGSESQIYQAMTAASLVLSHLRQDDPIFANASGSEYWSGSGNRFQFDIFFFKP
jgi:hypothetical protein